VLSYGEKTNKEFDTDFFGTVIFMTHLSSALQDLISDMKVPTASLYVCKLQFSIKWCVCRDNDRSSLNCASMLKGGWWWKSCGRGLNGLYLNDPQDLTARQGMNDSRNVEHIASTL